jgi:nitroreductase
MSLLLVAKEAGLDTITMSGYDSTQLRAALKIPDRYLDVMMIAMGKGVKQGHKTVRHDVSKVIFNNRINV